MGDANSANSRPSTPLRAVAYSTPTPAYAALLLHMYDDAKFMLDIHVGPLLGALVVTNTAWNALSPDDQVKVAWDAPGL